MHAIEPAAPATKLPWYRHLYVQVLVAILLGALLGHFAPATAEAMKPVQDRALVETDAGRFNKFMEALGPRVEFHTVPGASHFSFLAPCGLLKPPMLCADPKGFDRKAFHAEMNASVLAFFDRTLRGG